VGHAPCVECRASAGVTFPQLFAAVFERDGNQCTYVSGDIGKRCPETHRLEFHHVTPFSVGGEHDVSNITLRCAAHNALAAEEDFGRELVEEKKGSSHESFVHSGESFRSPVTGLRALARDVRLVP
jgi:hypothetical protein